MAEVERLYQIIGYENHSKPLIPDQVANTFFPLRDQLILGIMPCGASYILIHEENWPKIPGMRNPKAPWLSTRFVSLSPIQFNTFNDFKKKLGTYNSKKANKDRRDRSKANTQYTTNGNTESSERGLSRGRFEHQRLLYRFAQGSLYPLSHFAISPVPWLENLRIISFAYNLWEADDRTKMKRERDPKIMDVGWTEYALQPRGSGLTAISTVHLRVKENSVLGNPGRKKQEFGFGDTEVLSQEDVAARVRQLLVPPKEGTRSPILVLFANKDFPKEVFASLGVDSSNWHKGIEPILRPMNSTISKDLRSFSPDNRPDSSRNGRNRSRSPVRGGKFPPRRSSPVRSSAFWDDHKREKTGPVFSVDVREMFSTMTKRNLTNDFVIDHAISLGVPDVILDTNAPVEKRDKVWCAGNESRLIGNMWNAMASGNAIDDQMLARWPSSGQTGMVVDERDTVEPEEVKQESKDSDSDSERDPNDVGQLVSNPQASGHQNSEDQYDKDVFEGDWY